MQWCSKLRVLCVVRPSIAVVQYVIPMTELIAVLINVIMVNWVFDWKYPFHFPEIIVDFLTTVFVHYRAHRPHYAAVKKRSGYCILFLWLPDHSYQKRNHIFMRNSYSPSWKLAGSSMAKSSNVKHSNNVHSDWMALNSGKGMVSTQFNFLNSNKSLMYQSKCFVTWKYIPTGLNVWTVTYRMPNCIWYH